ncbi:MAG: hypothetical protein U9R36_04310, partial [Elusimicrobiota bacterium]|nr:hypothetical protein [Elusimicrobiota bacterium]
YRTVDRDFQTITTPAQNQDRTSYSVNAALKVLPFMPVSGSYSESEVITPSERIKPGDANPYLSSEDEGEVITKTGKVNSALNIKHLPALKGSYGQQVTESNLSGKKEEGLNYRGDISYRVPLNLLILPRTIRGYYRNTDNYITYEDYKRIDSKGGFENLFENTVEYFGAADFNLLNFISLKPSYKKNEKDKEWEFYSGLYADSAQRWPFSRAQNTAADARINFTGWFTPRFKYSVNIDENYNYKTSSGVTLLAGNKDVNRNFDLTGSVGLPANKVLPFVKPLNSLNLSASLNFTRGETYENIENSYYVFDKLDQRYELEPSTPAAQLATLSRQNSKKYTAGWRPFEFLSINKGIFNMFGGMRAKFVFSRNNNKKETTGTSIENINTTWPDIEIDYGAVDKFYPGEEYIKNIRLKSNYRFKEDLSYANSLDISRKIGVNYGADCRVYLLSDYDSLFQYSKKWEEEFDLEQDIKTNRTEDITYSGQVKFVLKKYWDLIARYSQRDIRKEAYNSEDPFTDMRTYTPSLKFSAIIDMPTEIKLPFREEKIKLANKLRVNGEIKADFSRSVLNIDKDNTDKYIFNASAGMDMSSNIRVTLGTGGQYLYNRVKKENSYFAFHINSDMVIRF